MPSLINHWPRTPRYRTICGLAPLRLSDVLAADPNRSTATRMPHTFDIPGTNPPIQLKIIPTAHRTEVSSVQLTSAVIKGYRNFLFSVLTAGHDRPLPREGVTFTAGEVSIHALNAVDVLHAGGVLDYQTLSAVFQAIWWLLNNHGHYTYVFTIVLGSRHDFVAGTVHVSTRTSNSVKQERD